jgi:hypothetical protein
MIDARRIQELVVGHGPVRAQTLADWKGEFALPASVEHFYRDVGPVDVTIQGYGNPYFLPALSGLWEFQAGYRWRGGTRERINDWDDDWLVVADEGGDPFIVSRSSGCVLLAQHGTGTWDPGEVFPDIGTMAACLAILGGIVRDAGESLTDERSYIRPESHAFAQRQLAEVLADEGAAEGVLAALGWG